MMTIDLKCEAIGFDDIELNNEPFFSERM